MSNHRPNTSDRAALARGIETNIRPVKVGKGFVWSLQRPKKGEFLQSGVASTWEEAERAAASARRIWAREIPMDGLGDAARSQEEHIDAAFVALEDGDCKRASREIAEAKSHGKIRHGELLERQLRQACSVGMAGAASIRRGRRGKTRRPRISLPPEAFVPVNRAPAPMWAYLIGYGVAGFIAYKLFAGPKPVAGSLFGLAGGCGSCGGSCLGCTSKARASYR